MGHSCLLVGGRRGATLRSLRPGEDPHPNPEPRPSPNPNQERLPAQLCAALFAHQREGVVFALQRGGPNLTLALTLTLTLTLTVTGAIAAAHL